MVSYWDSRNITVFIWGIVNILASLLNFYLLKKNTKENSYNTIVLWMTISQFMYDFLYSTDNFMGYNYGISMWSLDQKYITNSFITIYMSSGIACGLFALVFSWILFYIVTFKAYIDLSFFKIVFLRFVFCITFLYGLSELIILLVWGNKDPISLINTPQFTIIYDVYQYLRLATVAIIIIFTSSTLYTLSKMKFSKHERKNHPIYVLAKKTFIYPIIQLIIRTPYYVSYQMFPFPMITPPWLSLLSALCLPSKI